MSKLENLIKKHAKYADLKSDLKRKIGVLLSNHKYSDDFEDVFCGDNELQPDDITYGTCGNHAYEALKILNNQQGDFGYDEVLHMYGCDSCIKARKLKIEMGFVGTKLGQIRGAITRAGRKLNKANYIRIGEN